MKPKIPISYLLLYTFAIILILYIGFFMSAKRVKTLSYDVAELGDDMETDKKLLSDDYSQLLDELNSKYFEKVCDIFDTAKNQLLSELKNILGKDYEDLALEVTSLKKQAANIRESADNEPNMLELKEKLERAKIEFVEAKDETIRVEKKKVLNAVLSEIASRNLKIFAEMAEIRKQIEVKRNAMSDIVKEKESEYKTLEKKIITTARQQTVELTVSYESEVSALSYAFDVKNYSNEMPFLSVFDPNIKLMDFNKKAFMDAFNKKGQTCGSGCTGNCSSCASTVVKQKEKNYFSSETDTKFKN